MSQFSRHGGRHSGSARGHHHRHSGRRGHSFGAQAQSSEHLSDRLAGRGQYQPRRGQSTISDRSLYTNTAVAPQEQEVYVAKHTFADFGLHQSLFKNIASRGYSTPTPIQDQAIPMLLSGKDVVGIANTGTGKTAAFLLPLIQKILLHPEQRALILAPTRELAVQIMDEFLAFTRGMNMQAAMCIGGKSIQTQSERLRHNPHMVIGTPGRMKDLVQRGAFQAQKYTNVVLDEVDRMLDIGFRPDIKFLIARLSAQRQSAFFSATMNNETAEIMHAFLTNPEIISVKRTETNTHIQQDVIRVQSGQNKLDLLCDMLKKPGYERVIVFGRTKHGINKLEQMLSDRGVRVSAIHGNKSQNARQRALHVFKQGYVQALLATDIAARGIDIDNVTHVINYDEPMTKEDYVHRIGRTGRAGKAGHAITFVG